MTEEERSTGFTSDDDHIEELVPVGLLNLGDSPRLHGVDLDHVKTLAQVETSLPPIIVHRSTMQVIDGLHRLRATVQRGRREIGVRYFEGDENAAFVVAVKSNIAHGLPLTLADRSAAAKRILHAYPQWSNGVIASIVGLSAATVGALRQRSTHDFVESNTRFGRDGRVRPLSAADGRRLAGALITERPEASLREIARASGISPATAKDVRERLSRGEDPVPPKQRGAERGTRAVAGRTIRPHRARPTDLDSAKVIMSKLRRDPSLRFTEVGRALLHWLDSHITGLDDWSKFADRVPAHCTFLIAELAELSAQSWNSLAMALNGESKADGYDESA